MKLAYFKFKVIFPSGQTTTLEECAFNEAHALNHIYFIYGTDIQTILIK